MRTPDDRREMRAAPAISIGASNRRVSLEDKALIETSAGRHGIAEAITPGPLGRTEVSLRSFARRISRTHFRRAASTAAPRRRAGMSATICEKKPCLIPNRAECSHRRRRTQRARLCGPIWRRPALEVDRAREARRGGRPRR